ncbi:MAG: site-specific DNA-methyltransferase [Roseiflexaceae bacterium]
MTQVTPSHREQFDTYTLTDNRNPLFLCGDAADVLAELPDSSIDCCMTSPPYWGQREYNNGGIGLEQTPEEYIFGILTVFSQIKRVLKDSGSLWLNLGDTYVNKCLTGLPWRVAITLMDHQQWIMRNDVVWNKIKGPDNSQDKLRNNHEYLFHFVKQPKEYYYDVNAIRSKPREAKIKNGAVVSATGVTGVRYKRQIELSTSLTSDEKENAFKALNAILEQVAKGQISDFRMVIRNQQRITHSDSKKLSGRAKELAQKGYYFLKYHPDGSKPGDVWDIVPEDTQKREEHYAAYPTDLCRIPILATCPPNGIVLDPFCGTGTTNLVALFLERKSIGIDISQKYIDMASQRCRRLL